jgi:hypothetical protein
LGELKILYNVSKVISILISSDSEICYELGYNCKPGHEAGFSLTLVFGAEVAPKNYKAV